MPSRIILHGAAQPPVIISQLCHCRRCLVASGAPPQLSPSRGKAGRQLCPFSSWPVGQYVWNVSGVFGHSGVGAGREWGKKKRKENNRESGGCDAPGNVVDVVSRSEQIPNGAGLHTFPAQWNSLALLIIQGLRRAAGLTLCLQPHYQNWCLLDHPGAKKNKGCYLWCYRGTIFSTLTLWNVEHAKEEWNFVISAAFIDRMIDRRHTAVNSTSYGPLMVL